MTTYPYPYDNIEKLFLNKSECLGVYEETMGLLNYDGMCLASLLEVCGPYMTFYGRNSSIIVYKKYNETIELNGDGGIILKHAHPDGREGKKTILYPVSKIYYKSLLEDML
jgi:hypothetical protein